MTTYTNRPKHTTFVKVTEQEKEGFTPLPPFTPAVKGYWVYWREPSGRDLYLQPYRHYVPAMKADSQECAKFIARKECHIAACCSMKVVESYV